MICKSCGNKHQEKFCPACGEKEFKPSQLSVKHFVEETFEGFVHFDNKFLFTLKTLITKPGKLSLDYTEGRKVKYMKPIQFFLVTNLLFFFLYIGNNIFSLPLYNYITYENFTIFHTKETVQEKLQSSKLSFNEFRQQFDEKITSDSKEFIFVFIPLYGAVFYLFLFRKKQYFSEHLIFAAHFMAFVLLLNLASNYLLKLPFYWFFSTSYFSATFDTFSSIAVLVIMAAYLAFAIHRFYKPHIIWTVFVSLAAGGVFILFVECYRMLLFYKIMYWG